MEELIKAFDPKGISKSPSVFDYDKLEWVNAEHIKNMSYDEFISHAKPFFDQLGISESNYPMLEEILKPRITRFTQLPEKLEFLTKFEDFDLSLFEHKKSKSTLDTSKAILSDILPKLQECDWNRDALSELLTGYATEHEMKNALVMWPVRIAAAGVAVTPGGCAEVLILLGKDESLRRINIGLERLMRS